MQQTTSNACIYIVNQTFLNTYISSDSRSSVGTVFRTVHTCNCQPLVLQLIRNGLFASAPLRPSLAVDLRVLEFTRHMFLRLPPNITSWTAGLQSYAEDSDLDIDTYSKASPSYAILVLLCLMYCIQLSQRNRFSRSFQWYCHMFNNVEHVAQQLINEAYDRLDSQPTEAAAPLASVSGSLDNTSHSNITPLVDEGPNTDARPRRSKRTRPSLYLRRRCNLCFGGPYSAPGEEDKDPYVSKLSNSN